MVKMYIFYITITSFIYMQIVDYQIKMAHDKVG